MLTPYDAPADATTQANGRADDLHEVGSFAVYCPKCDGSLRVTRRVDLAVYCVCTSCGYRCSDSL